MDAVGLIASIITLLDLVHKGLETARLLYRAPHEISLLDQELINFDQIIKEVEALPEAAQRGPALKGSLQRARELMLQLHDLVQHELVESTAYGRKAKRIAWARKRPKVHQLKIALTSSRADLTLALTSSIS